MAGEFEQAVKDLETRYGHKLSAAERTVFWEGYRAAVANLKTRLLEQIGKLTEIK